MPEGDEAGADDIEVHHQEPRHYYEKPLLLVMTPSEEWFFAIYDGTLKPEQTTAAASCRYTFHEEGKDPYRPSPLDPVPDNIQQAILNYDGPYGPIDDVMNPVGDAEAELVTDGGQPEAEDDRVFLAGQGHSDGGHYSMEIFHELEDAKEYVESLPSLLDGLEWELHPNIGMGKGSGGLYLEGETLYYGFEQDWKGFVKEKEVR